MRTFLSLLLVLCISLSLATCLWATGEPVALGFKFAEGGQVTYDVVFSGAGKLLAPNAQTSPVTLLGSMNFTQSIANVQPDGSAVLDTLVPRVDFTVTIADKKARFAYADGAFHWYLNGQEQVAPQTDMTKAPLFGSPIRVTMKPDGTVTDISFADAQLMEALRKMMPNLGAGLPTQSSLPMFPAQPIAVGESWTQEGDLPLGPGQTATYRTRHTLESLESKAGMDMAKLTGYGEVKFRCGEQTVTGPGGQQVSIGIPEMKETITSTEFFNVGAGRLVRGDYDLALTMKMSAGVAGVTQSGAVEIRMRATVVGR